METSQSPHPKFGVATPRLTPMLRMMSQCSPTILIYSYVCV